MASTSRTDSPVKEQPVKVLVVDDDFHTCQVLKHTLEHAGYEPVIFSDPFAIDPKSIAWRYPIAVLDFMMPGMTGLDLFRRIRQYDPIIDAIILTGKADYEDAIAGYQIGIASWVTKPWTKELLLSEIARVLLRQRTLIKRLREEFKILNFSNLRARLRATEAVANSTRNQIRTLRQSRD